MTSQQPVPPSDAEPAGKNIVLCFDGTGNQIKARGNTNVVRLYDMLELNDMDRQIAFYDPGVGTFASLGAFTAIAKWFSKLLGLAFGYGMRTNLADGYTYLMQTYRPGDRIYLFGFSRGAYTARALAGMLYRAGLPRPGAENLVPYAVRYYARNKSNWTEDDWDQIDKYSESFSQTVDGSRAIPVHFMGIWDSVRAGGIFRWTLKWPYTRQLPNVQTVYHAVSIHEKRRPYKEYVVIPKQGADKPDLCEVWFAGVHSDVGGTFADDPRLADITLKWMIEHAMDAGLRVRTRLYKRRVKMEADQVRGLVHKMGWVWVFLTYKRRRIPGGAWVHQSVQDRIDVDPEFEVELPQDMSWDDPGWKELRH